MAADVILLELPLIDAPVRAFQQPNAMLLAESEVTEIAGLIGECLLSFAMGVLVLPLALVKGAIRVSADAASVHEVVRPLTLVNRPISMYVGAMTCSLASLPVAKVVRLVTLLAETKAVLLLSLHLADVDRPARRFDDRVASLSVQDVDFDLVGQVTPDLRGC